MGSTPISGTATISRWTKALHNNVIRLRSVCTAEVSSYLSTHTTSVKSVVDETHVVRECIDQKPTRKNHKCLKMVPNSFINISSKPC